MGIDISFYAERRQPDGSFALVSGMEPNEYLFLGDEEKYSDDSPPWPPLIPKESLDIGRNYPLYAILADVRNGMRTADDALFETIASPRGLPTNLSPELKAFTDEWGEMIAPSWLWLDEVLAFPWQEKVIVHEAMVDERAAPAFGYKRPLFPWQEWHGPKTPRVGLPYEQWPEGVPVRWQVTYDEAVGGIAEIMEPLLGLGDPADTRLVFWFN